MNTEKEALKFAKNFKKELTFSDLKNYLENNLHYKLLFFDTTIAQKEIEFLNLKVSKKEKGLTVNVSDGTCKFVFMRSDLTDDDKIHCILHEIGHIVLGHMEISSRELSNEKIERDAELFSYIVLANVKRRSAIPNKKMLTVMTAVICIETVLLSYTFFNNINKTPHSADKSVFANITADRVEETEDVWFVLPTGTKYHRKSCKYVTDKAMAIDAETAESNYDACKVCRP